MTKYIIHYDYGYGAEYEIVEEETEEEAVKYAYGQWKEGVEAQADYGVIGEVTEELLEEYGLEEI